MTNDFALSYSDTAQADLQALERDPGFEAELARTRALLARIAKPDTGAPDQILEACGFELRYQSSESTYVFFRRDDTARSVLVIYLFERAVRPAEPALPKPPVDGASIAHTEGEEEPKPYTNGYHRGASPSSVAGGSADASNGGAPKYLARVQTVDLGDRYIIFQHSATSSEPGSPVLIFGSKGSIEGDFRKDQREKLLVKRDGSVARFPPQTVQILIRNPFEGMSQEAMTAYTRDFWQSEEGQRRMEIARENQRTGAQPEPSPEDLEQAIASMKKWRSLP